LLIGESFLFGSLGLKYLYYICDAWKKGKGKAEWGAAGEFIPLIY
jgi:hypothetical protein